MLLKHLIFFSVLTLSSLSLSTTNSFANETDNTDPETHFTQGQIFYENDEFDKAVSEFTVAIRKSPNNSSYHHWLAKSYGELAESSGWFKAMRLAENSRDSLRRAVELDPENINALKDLMRYYQQAPAFLGGNEEKANKISIQLESFKEKQSTTYDRRQIKSDP